MIRYTINANAWVLQKVHGKIELKDNVGGKGESGVVVQWAMPPSDASIPCGYGC